jgi:sterol 3beta-glucosyltransferase
MFQWQTSGRILDLEDPWFPAIVGARRGQWIRCVLGTNMARKIVLMTLGTRGDVQPYLALGQGLQRAGFDVTLATSLDFGTDVVAHGLKFAPIHADFQSIVESPDGRAALAGDLRAIIRLVRHTVLPMTFGLLEDCRRAAEGADALIYHPKSLAGPHLAEKMGVPVWRGFYLPMLVPTSAFPFPLLTRTSLGRFANWQSYRLLEASQLFLAGTVRRWRQSLGMRSELPRGFERALPVIYGFSRHLIPPPADWDSSVNVTGFWYRDPPSDLNVPVDLLEFLGDGPPPVFIGFGSMSSKNPVQTAEVVCEAVRLAGCRAIVSEGWGGMAIDQLPNQVIQVREIPHEWLFPRVSAVVHHGGAGTTATAIRAGIPSVVCPFAADQPYWGHIVFKHGLGPRPIAQKKLRPDHLAKAIVQAVQDSEIRKRSETMGALVAAEAGVDDAVRIVSGRLS